MKLPHAAVILLVIFVFSSFADAQTRRPVPPNKAPASAKSKEIGSLAVVIDETLSVLRAKPSLFAEPIQRMRRGRRVQILGAAEADGVRFYRVSAPPVNTGWIQADAVFGKFREGDEPRFASLIQAANGFDRIELAAAFLDIYKDSVFRPAILLLHGDLVEEIALKLTRDASNRLSRNEMAATGAPMHSYYLNFVSLDRYRKLGIVFWFNPATRKFHYDGATWREIVKKYPTANESAEAQKRLDSLKQKMETPKQVSN